MDPNHGTCTANFWNWSYIIGWIKIYYQPEIIVSIKPHNYVKKIHNRKLPCWKQKSSFVELKRRTWLCCRKWKSSWCFTWKKNKRTKTSDSRYPELGAKAPGPQPWYHLQWFRWPAKGHNPIDVQRRPFLNQPLKASISTLMIYNTVLNTHTHT